MTEYFLQSFQKTSRMFWIYKFKLHPNKNRNHLGDMVSSDIEKEKSIMDDSSGDEDTSDTLDMDWVVT